MRLAVDRQVTRDVELCLLWVGLSWGLMGGNERKPRESWDEELPKGFDKEEQTNCSSVFWVQTEDFHSDQWVESR